MVEKNKNQEIKKLKYALYDMVNQFADEEKGNGIKCFRKSL